MKKVSEIAGKIRQYVRNNPSEMIFGGYLFLVLFASVFFVVTSLKFAGGALLFALLVFYTVFTIVPKIHKGVLKVSFEPPSDISFEKKRKIFLFSAGIAFIVLLIDFIGSYPGAFSSDSISQYKQAITNQYSDWHPVWHTFLFFTLPLKFTCGWSGSITFFQIIYFSLFIGYMTETIWKYAGKLYVLLSVGLILLIPFTLDIVMSPQKDVAFAISGGFCMLYAVNIYFTDGEWIKKWYRVLLFAFMAASATIFRHNGILFTFFLLAALFFYISKKYWFLLSLTTVVIFLSIKIPFYSILDVQKPGNRVTEIMGLPLSVLLNVAKESPESIDIQTAEFIDELMEIQPEWKENLDMSGFNSVKFKGINSDIIEKNGVEKILKMTLNCFLKNPKEALKALVGVTIPVYGLEKNCVFVCEIPKNDLGIVFSGAEVINFAKKCYVYFISYTPLRCFFSTIGMTILIILAFIIFKSDLRKKDDRKRFYLCIPILFYNFGTMLLLSGCDVRFFYISFLVCPLVVLIMGGKRLSESPEEKSWK